MNASGSVPGCAMIYRMVAEPQILRQLYDNAKQYDNDDVCHNNGTVEVT